MDGSTAGGDAADRDGQRVQVARVTVADVDGVVPLMQQYCRFYEVDVDPAALEGVSRACLDDPERTGIQLIARAATGLPLGFATVFWTWETTGGGEVAVMNDLYVVAESRGQGVGRALLEACGREAVARGIGRLTWQTAPDNTRAQALYDRVGAAVEQWYEYTLQVGGP